MKVDIGSIAGHLARLSWVAVRSFVGTLLAFTFAGFLFAGLSWYFLSEYPWIYGVSAAAVALIESVTTGVLLGGKRAGVMALAHGLGTLRLGRSLVRIVFDRMLGIAATESVGERGGWVAQRLERLPLARAEELLSDAIRGLTGEAERAGWVRRKIQGRLLDLVRKYTLARFREEGAKQGGIDLLKVKEELEQTVDDAVVKKVRSGLGLLTGLAIIGLPVVVFLQTLIVIMLLK